MTEPPARGPSASDHVGASEQPAHWLQVIALIAGMELPNAATDLGDCVIVPLGRKLSTPPRAGGLGFQPAVPNASAVVTVEPEIRFDALHAVTTVVTGKSGELEAREVATERFDRAIGLIAIAQGPDLPPPLIQIVSVVPVPERTQQGTQLPFDIQPLTQSKVSPLIINPMSAATASRFTALDALARSEQHVATLIRLWGAAEQADRTSFSAPDRDACQVHYCKVIEQVAIAMRLGRFEPTQRELAEAVSLVESAFGIGQSQAVKAAAIEKAATKLRDARVDGTNRRLKKALEILGVEDKVRDAAIEVLHLRNTRAGHPSSASVSDGQVMQARWTAAELVKQYFNWRWTSSTVSKEPVTP